MRPNSDSTCHGAIGSSAAWRRTTSLFYALDRVIEGTGRAFKILRAATLLLIPFSWIVFYNEDAYPREGHILWVASMVVALFSQSPSSSRLMTEASHLREAR